MSFSRAPRWPTRAVGPIGPGPGSYDVGFYTFGKPQPAKRGRRRRSERSNVRNQLGTDNVARHEGLQEDGPVHIYILSMNEAHHMGCQGQTGATCSPVASLAPTLLTSTPADGAWQISESKLGNAGNVFRGRWGGQDVAIKWSVKQQSKKLQDEMNCVLQTEMDLLVRCANHSNVLSPIFFDKTFEQHAMVLPLLGPPLSDLIKTTQVDEEVLQCVIGGVLAAGVHLQQCLVGHLDIKMSNVLAHGATSLEPVMLVDFDAGVALMDENERAGPGFRIHRKPGTPALWSQEAFFGSRPTLMENVLLCQRYFPFGSSTSDQAVLKVFGIKQVDRYCVVLEDAWLIGLLMAEMIGHAQEGVQVGENCVAVARQLQLSENARPTAREARSLLFD